MPGISQKFITRENGFKGYNDRNPPEFLPKGYLADALNCLCGTDEIVKRSGYTMIADDLGNMQCQGLKGVQLSDGTKFLLSVFNGTIYKWTGSGNWTSLGGTLSTTEKVEIVIANNAAYFFDGINSVPKYDGSLLTTAFGVPIGKHGRWFHNQLHVTGILNYPNKLKSSTIGDPETFTGGTSSDLDINPNDGDYISGLNTLKDQLFAFKTKRVWSASGFGTAALTLSSISELVTGVGTLSHRSIVNIGNELLYISFFGGVAHFRSVIRTLYGVIVDNGIISLDIENTMKTINTSQLQNVAGTFDGRYVYWSVPITPSTTNNAVLVFDTVKRAWTRFDGIRASVWDNFTVSSSPQIYFGEASADSKVYVMDNSTSDNGTAINFQAISRRFGGEESEHKNKYKWLYIRAKETGNYDVDVNYSADGFTYDSLGTLNLSGTGSVLDSIVLDQSRLGSTDLKRKRFTIPKSRHYYVQFKFSDTSATSQVTIRNWALIYEKRKPLEE